MTHNSTFRIGQFSLHTIIRTAVLVPFFIMAPGCIEHMTGSENVPVHTYNIQAEPNARPEKKGADQADKKDTPAHNTREAERKENNHPLNDNNNQDHQPDTEHFHDIEDEERHQGRCNMLMRAAVMLLWLLMMAQTAGW